LKHLLIGCGDLGQRLAKNLFQMGQEVHSMRRRAEQLPGWMNPITQDLLQLKNPERLEGFDWIYLILAPTEHSLKTYQKTYLEGCQHLAQLLCQMRTLPQRVVYVSSTRVYAQANGEWVDEQSPVNASDEKSEVLIQAEQVIQALPIAKTIIRFSGLYDPLQAYLVQAIRQKQVFSDVSAYTNRIHRDDASRFLAYLHSLAQPESLYLATDSEPVLKQAYLEWLAKALKETIHFKPEQNKPSPKGKKCANQRMLSTGFKLLYPSYREGYQSLLEMA